MGPIKTWTNMTVRGRRTIQVVSRDAQREFHGQQQECPTQNIRNKRWLHPFFISQLEFDMIGTPSFLAIFVTSLGWLSDPKSKVK